MNRHIGWFVLAILLIEQPTDSSAEVTDTQVKDVAKELACLCGTCPRRPLDECTCGTAEMNRERIRKELEAGKDKEMIIAGFISEFGKQSLSKPPTEGFDLIAWIMPGVVLLLGGVVVRSVLHRWGKAASDAQPNSPVVKSVTPETDAYLSRLEQELRDRNT